MGIEPDIEYGNDCLACWTPGKTPKKLWVSFSGIKALIGLMAPFVGAANSTIELTQKTACYWENLAPPIGAYYKTGLPGSILSAWTEGLHPTFTATSPNNCVFGFANELPGLPEFFFAGGYGHVSWVP